MLSADARDRLAVVLVGARNPQNIGAAARAMQDFGFTDLRIVNEFAPPFEAARLEASSAVRADEVMRSAKLFSTLAEALADCTTVAGTTAVGDRNVDLSLWTLRDAAPALRRALNTTPPKTRRQSLTDAGESEVRRPLGSKCALLFGSEKTGLTREQLSFCSVLLTIPLLAPPGRHLSMNLGQSVAVCLYELTREGFEGSRQIPEAGGTLATEADRERLTTILSALMRQSGYTRRFPANARLTVVRQLVNKLGTTREEATTWMGFFRLIVRALEAATGKDTPQEPPK